VKFEYKKSLTNSLNTHILRTWREARSSFTTRKGGGMRLNLEISEERVRGLERLLNATDTETMKDLVNEAFTILEWVVDETKAGNEVAAVNEDKQVFRACSLPDLTKGTTHSNGEGAYLV